MIGILTFNRTVNYGAVLQSFALKCAFEKKGAKASIINYQNAFVEKNETIKFKIGKGFVKRIVRNLLYRKKYKKFYRFINQISTERIYRREDFLNNTFPKINKIVVGSDQVWNYKCSGNDRTFLLDAFPNLKKYSYAASFGVSTLPEEQVADFKENLSKLEKISIREKTGKRILCEQLKLDSKIVLDPTLLLTQKEWKEKMCDHNNCTAKSCDKGYVLVYTINLNDNIKNIARNIGKEKNLPVYNISLSAKDFWGDKCIKNAGPDEWVELFKNASFVVTDSFHGTAFSVNFNKQFYTYAKNEKQSRIVDLLGMLEIENRRISDENEVDLTQSIDYDGVNAKLEQERNKSFEFIESIING